MTFRTLKEAAEYILTLPKEQKELAWRHTADCLKNAAEREIAWMLFGPAAMVRVAARPR